MKTILILIHLPCKYCKILAYPKYGLTSFSLRFKDGNNDVAKSLDCKRYFPRFVCTNDFWGMNERGS